MRARSRSRRAATRAAVMTVLCVAALLGILPVNAVSAGQPMTMTDEATGTSRAPADTARRAVKKTAPTTPAKTAPGKSAPVVARPTAKTTAAPTAAKTASTKARPLPAATGSRIVVGAKATPKAATTPAGVASRAKTSGVAARPSPGSRAPGQATAPMVARVAPAATSKSGAAATGPTGAHSGRTSPAVTQSVAVSPAQGKTTGRSVSAPTRIATQAGGAGAKTLGVGTSATVSVVKLPRQPAGTATTPATGPSKGKVQAPVAALEDHVTYQYNALGRRDPFKSLMEGEYVGVDGGGAAPDLGGLKVVGIVWGSLDQFAMAEDVRGNSYVLRRGDRVMNGFVEGLKRDAMIVNITVDGQSQSVSIPVTRKGERTNASR